MMDPTSYALQLRAVWVVPTVLSDVDLEALLADARQIGSDKDIELIERLIVADVQKMEP